MNKKTTFNVRLLLCLLFFSCHLGVFSQITFSVNKQKIRDVIKVISDKSDYSFFYSNDFVDLNKEVIITVDNENIKTILDKLFKDTDIQYTIRENKQIVLAVKGKKIQDNKTVPLKKITGQVKDSSGEPVIGASILIKENKIGTITDIEGNFTVDALLGNTLVISFLGYKTKEIKINNQTNFNIDLSEDSQALDEIVVVGYGTQKKINLSGAVEAVNGKTLENRSVSNVGSMLQGIVPNLNISVSGGQSSKTPSFNVRGVGNLEGKNASPLILVDGIPTDESDFSRMNSADIESISVLKDASSAAIYGARAAFGVIIVSTKRGKGEKMTVNFSNTVNVRTLGRMPKIVKDPYIQASYKDIMGAPWYDLYSDEELEYAQQRSENPSLPTTMINPRKPEYYSYLGMTDWFHEIFGNTGLSHSHNLNLSGATKKTSFYLGVEYYGEEGMIKYNTDQYNRFNMRSRVDYQVTDWLKIGNNTSMTYYTYDYPTSLGDWLYKEVNNANCLIPVHNPDGSYTELGAKYVGGLLYGGDSSENSLTVQSQFTFDISLIKDIWSVKGDFTAKFWNNHLNSWEGDHAISFKEGPELQEKSLGWEDIASGKHNNSRFLLFNVYTDFNKKIGKHNLAGVIGFEQETESLQYFVGSRKQLLSSSAPTVDVATGEQNVADLRYSWATRSGFFRLNYSFGDRYIIEANGRYDGTSRFQKNSRFGFFPSVSAAWIISEEKFFQPIKDWFSTAKIRTSYGSLGNQNVGYYEYITDLKFEELKYLLNGKKPIGASAPGLISDALTWETVNTVNLGIDLNFLNNKLNLSGDVYRRDTKDMLTTGKTLPGVLGTDSPRTNAADLKTRGWEASIAWRDQFNLSDEQFNYGVRFVISDSRSFITKYDNPKGNLNDYYKGYEIGSIWGLTTEGFFIDEEDIKKHADQWEVTAYPGDRPLAPGDLKYKDLDKNGKINKGDWTKDNHGDYSIIGNTSERYNYGADLTADWNGFDLRIFLQGVGKKDWYPNLFTFFGIYRAPWSNVLTNNLDHWTPENPNAYFPRLKSYTAETAGDMSIAQTRYLQNAAYVRIKNITFGYTVPQEWTRKANIEKIRLYFSGENVGEITKLSKNYDPEALNLTHPMQRVFSFGLNITL